LNDYYFKEYDHVLTPIYDKTKPLFAHNFINFDYKGVVLEPHISFIVEEFINKQVGLNHKPKELYEMYKTYRFYIDAQGVELNKTQFGAELAEVGIKTIKSGTNIYKISYLELYDIGLKNEWYYRDAKDAEIDALKGQLDYHFEKIEELTNVIDNLKFEIVQLQGVEYMEAEDAGVQCSEEDFEEEEDGEMVVDVEEEDDDDDECTLESEDLVEKLL
jgi:hypothetical protein